MLKRNDKIITLILMLLAAVVMLMAGCSKPGYEGTAKVNQPPRCFLANIPVEGQKYSSNPLLYWYATDEDGFITMYRYIVKRAQDINNNPEAFVESVLETGNYSGWTVIYTDSLTPGKSATADTIQLFADPDPAIYTPQYFFVQAVDNHGAVSKFTDTLQGNITALAYRLYSRNNNPPETYLAINDTVIYFTLPDTTLLYKGIPVSWSGSDSLDYKRAQPPFEYHWRVFGPFASRDQASADMDKFIYESHDSATGDVWVKDETTVLFNLYRHQPASQVTRADYFLFEVAARDDAFVPDTTPSRAVFKAVEPGFEGGILILDNNTYIGSGFALVEKDKKITTPDSNNTKMTMLQAYYQEIFQLAGYPVDRLRWHYVQGIPTVKKAPPVDTLVRYKLVVNLVENHLLDKKTEDLFPNLERYMSVGGKVLFIGWNSFSPAPDKGMKTFSTGTFPYKYFGIAGEYNTDWKNDPLGMPYGISQGVTPEEFIRAEALVVDLPQALHVDATKLNDYHVSQKWEYYDTIWTPKMRLIDHDSNFYSFLENAEPWVNYYIKRSAAPGEISIEAVYLAISLYSLNEGLGHNPREFHSKFPNQESIDGRVCGVRMKTDVFRSAAFGFSLYCMPKNEAVEFIRKMMDWFFAED